MTLDFDNGPSLTISDNGVGYDPALILNNRKPRTAWGLMGIQERANLINADLVLDSGPGKGTRLSIRLNSGKEVIDDNPGFDY
jgi:signal transduction histidine kinase